MRQGVKLKMERFLQDGERTVEQMVSRVSTAIGATDGDRAALSREMSAARFLPAGRTLKFAGAGAIPPNCAVLPMNLDDDGTLAQDASRMMRLSARTIGVGIDLGNIPPKGSPVNQRWGVISPGPVDSLRSLSVMMDTVSHWHRTHGHMAILPASHPEIEDFARLKRDPLIVTNFNLSVAVRSEFMGCAMRDDGGREAMLLRFLAECAHACAEPGLVFIDRVQTAKWRESMPDLSACVPCGEQFMHEYETCNLGAINLYAFVEGDSVLWEDLADTVRVAVRALHRVSGMLYAPDEDVVSMSRRIGRVGLGIMGWASALERLKLEYGGSESLALAEEIGLYMGRVARDEIRNVAAGTTRSDPPTITCIAPTGGISLLASRMLGTEISSGVEPYFHESTAIPARKHIDMQSAWQKHIDNSISKTVNMASSATVEDVLDCFIYAYWKQCKGITVYRDGSRGHSPIAIARCGAGCADVRSREEAHGENLGP